MLSISVKIIQMPAISASNECVVQRFGANNRTGNAGAPFMRLRYVSKSIQYCCSLGYPCMCLRCKCISGAARLTQYWTNLLMLMQTLTHMPKLSFTFSLEAVLTGSRTWSPQWTPHRVTSDPAVQRFCSYNGTPDTVAKSVERRPRVRERGLFCCYLIIVVFAP